LLKVLCPAMYLLEFQLARSQSGFQVHVMLEALNGIR